MLKRKAAATSEILAVSKPRTFPGWAAKIQSSFTYRRWRRWRLSWKDDSLFREVEAAIKQADNGDVSAWGARFNYAFARAMENFPHR
jgi:hypothetical protein